MAKKKGVKVNTTQARPQVWAIRAEFDEEDHARIEQVARALKLSKASLVRMATMVLIREELARIKP